MTATAAKAVRPITASGGTAKAVRGGAAHHGQGHDRTGGRGRVVHHGQRRDGSQRRDAVIVAAAICPSPPLLAPELTGQADILPELRAASAAAVARLLAAAPDVVVVAGPAETTGPCDPAGG